MSIISTHCQEIIYTIFSVAIQVFDLSKNVITNPAGIWSRYNSHICLMHFVASINLLCRVFKSLLKIKHSLYVTKAFVLIFQEA